jgi:menaquinone-dependent protoporphyrinogen oxidase
MNNGKILVAYASQAGSTAEIAEAIGNTIASHGTEVDVLRMDAVTDLAQYQAVVAGSSIQGSKWLPQAMRFMLSYQSDLARKPFAAFMVCITLGMAKAEQYREGLKAWMDPVRTIVRPVSEGYFAGLLDFKKLPVTSNTLGLRAAVALGVFPKGDHRDWDAIRSWTETTYPKLVG